MKNNIVMKSEYIERLLADFYEGNTSQEEESYLYNFFQKEHIPSHLETERNMFLKFYNSNRDIEIPNGLENRLEILIDKLEKSNKKSPKVKKINWKWPLTIAASIIIIASVCIHFLQTQEKSENPLRVDTYSDPEEAYIVTQQTLLFASNKLNKGLNQLESVQHDIDKVNKMTQKNIQQ